MWYFFQIVFLNFWARFISLWVLITKENFSVFLFLKNFFTTFKMNIFLLIVIMKWWSWFQFNNRCNLIELGIVKLCQSFSSTLHILLVIRGTSNLITRGRLYHHAWVFIKVHVDMRPCLWLSPWCCVTMLVIVDVQGIVHWEWLA